VETHHCWSNQDVANPCVPIWVNSLLEQVQPVRVSEDGLREDGTQVGATSLLLWLDVALAFGLQTTAWWQVPAYMCITVKGAMP
jgi:hypothetical protein